MARRKEFKTIADGLLSSFVSRNNDVYGYWGIGKLYSHMVSSKSMKLKIDLVQRTLEPRKDEFKVSISEFANRLMNQVRNRRLNHKFLKKAELMIIGFPNEPSPYPYYGKTAPNKIICRLIIVDDLNREHMNETNTWCRKHNPEKESKSTREYE